MTRKGTSWVDTEEERFGLARLAESVKGGLAALQQLARELKLPRECFVFSNFFSRRVDPWPNDWAVCEAMEQYLLLFYELKARFSTDWHCTVRTANGQSRLNNVATTIPWAMPGAKRPLMQKPVTGPMTPFNVFVLKRLLAAETLEQFLDPHWAPSSSTAVGAGGRLITADEKFVFACLLAAAKSRRAASAQHWNIVRYFLGKQIDLLTRARGYVPSVPDAKPAPELPYENDLRELGLYLTLGDVVPHVELSPEKPWDFRQVFRPDPGLERGDSSRPWSINITGHSWPWQDHVAHLLAAKAAFEVCQRIAEFRYRARTDKNWKRFCYIRKCRSPLCGKSFYTGDAGQVTCGRNPSARAAIVSACKKYWDSYRQWLRRNQHDSETAWDSPALKMAFLKVFRPRGPQ